MTMPSGSDPSGYDSAALDGTILGAGLSALIGRTQSAITEAKKLEVQANATWQALSAAFFNGLSPDGIAYLPTLLLRAIGAALGIDVSGWIELVDATAGLASFIIGLPSEALAAIQSLIDYLWMALTGETGITGKTAEQLQDALATIVGVVFGILNTLYDVFAETVGSTGKALADVLDAGNSFVAGAAGAATKIASLLTETGQASVEALGGLINLLLTMIQQIAGIFNGDSITAVNSTVQMVKDWWGATGGSLAGIVTGWSDLITGIGGTIVDDVVDAINDAVANASSAASDASSAISQLTTLITNAGGSVIGDVATKLNTAASDASGAVSNIATLITNISGAVIGDVSSKINTAASNASSATSQLATLISNISGSVIGDVSTKINNSSTQIASLISGISGSVIADVSSKINTAASNASSATSQISTLISNVSGSVIGDVSTKINTATTNISSIISNAGAANAAAVGTAVSTAATNIANIGTAAQNAAAGIVGSLGTAANQVQTAFSGVINSLVGGLFGIPSPANQTQAQATAALQGVTTNAIGNVASVIQLKNENAGRADLLKFMAKFSDYGGGVGTFVIGPNFTVLNDDTLGPNNGGGIRVVDGRAVYERTGSSGSASKIAQYNVASTTNLQEISWVYTGDWSVNTLERVYCRMNAAGTSFLRMSFGSGGCVFDAVVAGSVTYNSAYTATEWKPGARYTLKLGDLSDSRKIYLYENETLLYSFTDSVHQVGASYRYGGFGASGENNVLTVNGNRGFNLFGISDQYLPTSTEARLQTGTYASRPAVGYAGEIYKCTDVNLECLGNGSGWSNFIDGIGVTVPPTSGWSTTTLGSATFAADRDSRLLTVPSHGTGTDLLRIEYRTLSPAINYTQRFRFEASLSEVGVNILGGLILMDNSGKFIIFGPVSYSATQLWAYKWNSTTSGNSSYKQASITTMSQSLPKFLGIRDDGTNRYFEYSHNGVDWLLFYSVGRTDFITPTRIGWGYSNQGGNTSYVRMTPINTLN